MGDQRFLGTIQRGEWFVHRSSLCICTDSAPGLVAYTRLTGQVAHEYAVNHGQLHEHVKLVKVGIKTSEVN